MSNKKNFVVITEQDGVPIPSIVEALSPIEAMEKDTGNKVLEGTFGKGEQATIGIYELGSYNHLDWISDHTTLASWSTGKIKDLENDLERLQKKEKEK